MVLLPTSAIPFFKISDAFTELTFNETSIILSKRRLLFFALGLIKSNVSAKVVCLHSGFRQNISFYKQFTSANITEEKINTLLEKNKEKSGEYRIDSDAYPDAFQYKITENKEISFFLAGIVK